LCSEKIERRIRRIENVAQMEVEDMLSYLERERDKCIARMREAREYKEDTDRDKERWN
jgi:hypothetical protein